MMSQINLPIHSYDHDHKNPRIHYSTKNQLSKKMLGNFYLASQTSCDNLDLNSSSLLKYINLRSSIRAESHFERLVLERLVLKLSEGANFVLEGEGEGKGEGEGAKGCHPPIQVPWHHVCSEKSTSWANTSVTKTKFFILKSNFDQATLKKHKKAILYGKINFRRRQNYSIHMMSQINAPNGNSKKL